MTFSRAQLASNTPLGTPEASSGLFYAAQNFSVRKISLVGTIKLVR